MSKKIIALMISAIFALGLSACGGSDDDIKKADTSATSAQPQMPGSEAPASNTEKPAAADDAKPAEAAEAKQ